LITPKTILIVDDENDLLELISRSLKLRGYQTLEASGGHRAFDILIRERIDLVLSDIRMPEGDGLVLLQKIVLLKNSPVVIMMTGQSSANEKEILALGAKGFIHKPFSSKELMSHIVRWLHPEVKSGDTRSA
jgi:two-component system, OmpR family, response regulator RegX3